MQVQTLIAPKLYWCPMFRDPRKAALKSGAHLDRKPSYRERSQGLPTPEVPPLRPAALEPAWSRGRLDLLLRSAKGYGEPVVLVTVFKLLRMDITSLADEADRDGNIDQRSIASLRSVAGRIPGYIPAQEELFYLAHLKEW